MEAKTFRATISNNTSLIPRLMREGYLTKVWFCFKKGTGTFKRSIRQRFFKTGYLGKTFYLINNRTLVVRLISKGLKPPKTSRDQQILRSFLKRYLTDAEQIAVLWRLGVHNFAKSSVPNSIEVDGILKSRGRWQR